MHDIILCIEIPKDSTKKLLEIINEYCTFAGYKNNIQTSLMFLYTNNELGEIEIKKIIPFTIITKRIKYLGINLTHKVKDLYTENFKTLLKEIKEDTKKEKDI